MNITIFGAGTYGSALARILSRNFHNVLFYDPAKIQTSTQSAISHAEAFIIAVPSVALAETLSIINNSKKSHLPIISATKGQLYDENIFPKNFSIIYGPAFGSDLNHQKSTTFTITNYLSARLFRAPNLNFEYTEDLAGAMLISALKNIYAFAAGAEHLESSTQQFAYFINTAYRELKIALAFFNFDEHTADLACGLPDLTLTCSGLGSRNYAFGAQKITATENTTIESINTVKKHSEKLLQIPNTPILHAAITDILSRTQ